MIIAKIVSAVSTRSIHCDEMKVHAITTGTTFMLLLHCHATALLSNQSQSVACAVRTREKYKVMPRNGKKKKFVCGEQMMMTTTHMQG